MNNKILFFGLVGITLLLAFPVQSVFADDVPVITLIGSSPINLVVNQSYTELGAVCTDTEDGTIPVVVGGDIVDTTSTGTFVVTYDCTDSFPQSAVQVTRTVIVSNVPDVELVIVDIFCPTGSAIGLTEMVDFLEICPILGADPPVITIIGDVIIDLLVGDVYTELGATAFDNEDGDLTTSIVTSGVVNTSITGVNFITYNVNDSAGNNAVEKIRTIIVSEVSVPVAGVGGGTVGGGSVGLTPEPEEGVITPDQQLAFEEALANAIASIAVTEDNIIEQVIQTFFEFTVVDTVHEDIRLNSFLDNERLGLRWSTGDDIVIVSTTPAVSPFLFTFEQFPVIKQGSGAFVSTSFLAYNLQIPRNECTNVITTNCTQKVRYEVPVTVNAVIDGVQVSDTGTITVDLREGVIDPILLIILATFGIPIIGAIVQRSRNRATIEPLRRVVSG